MQEPDYRCRVTRGVGSDVGPCRCSCILKESSYRHRAAIDTKGMRKGGRTEGGEYRPGLNEFLNVIVMEKLFNLPLMPSRDTYAKLIYTDAHKKFILLSPVKGEECTLRIKLIR